MGKNLKAKECPKCGELLYYGAKCGECAFERDYAHIDDEKGYQEYLKSIGEEEVCKSCEEPLHGGLRELPIREGFEDIYVITCNDCGRYKIKGEEE